MYKSIPNRLFKKSPKFERMYPKQSEENSFVPFQGICHGFRRSIIPLTTCHRRQRKSRKKAIEETNLSLRFQSPWTPGEGYATFKDSWSTCTHGATAGFRARKSEYSWSAAGAGFDGGTRAGKAGKLLSVEKGIGK